MNETRPCIAPLGLRVEVSGDGGEAVDRLARGVAALYPLLGEKLLGRLVRRSLTWGGQLEDGILLRMVEGVSVEVALLGVFAVCSIRSGGSGLRNESTFRQTM